MGHGAAKPYAGILHDQVIAALGLKQHFRAQHLRQLVRPGTRADAEILDFLFASLLQIQLGRPGAVMFNPRHLVLHDLAAIAYHLFGEPHHHQMRIADAVPAIPEHRTVDVGRQVRLDLTGFVCGQLRTLVAILCMHPPPGCAAVVLGLRAVDH